MGKEAQKFHVIICHANKLFLYDREHDLARYTEGEREKSSIFNVMMNDENFDQRYLFDHFFDSSKETSLAVIYIYSYGTKSKAGEIVLRCA